MTSMKKVYAGLFPAVIALVFIILLSACNSNNKSGGATVTISTAEPTNAAEQPVTHIEPLNPDLLPQFLPMAEGEDIAVITTSMGEIRMRFFPEFAPKAVENFQTLATDGYYKDMIFHRVIEQFMIQTGDPLGTGTGGSSKWGEGFMTESSLYLHFFRGTVGMARSQSYDSNGSQFFIVQNNKLNADAVKLMEEYKENQEQPVPDTDAKLKDFYPTVVIDKFLAEGGAYYLDFEYTVFGQVYEGMDVVDKIAAVQTNTDDKPLTDVKLISIEIQKYTK